MVIEVGSLFPRADNLAARELVLDAVVDAVDAVRLAANEVGGVRVLHHSIDGVLHSHRIVREGVCMSWRAVPGEFVGVRAEAVGTVGGAAAEVRRAGKGHQPVGTQTELVLADAEKVEGVRDYRMARSKDVVRTDTHSCSEAESCVGRVVGDGVHIVGAVETLHGDVGHAAEDYLRVGAGDHGVPSLVAVARNGGMVVFLFDLHFGARRLHLGPLVFAAFDCRARRRTYGRRLAHGLCGGKKRNKSECYLFNII